MKLLFLFLTLSFSVLASAQSSEDSAEWQRAVIGGKKADLVVPVRWTGRAFGESYLDNKGVCFFYASEPYKVASYWPNIAKCISLKKEMLKKDVIFSEPSDTTTYFHLFFSDEDTLKVPKSIFIHRKF